MHLGVQSPIVDVFARGDVARDARLLAAQGLVAPRAHEQLALLAMMAADADAQVAELALATMIALPRAPLARFLARPDVPAALRAYYTERGLADRPADVAPDAESADAPLGAAAEAPVEEGPTAGKPEEEQVQLLSSLSVPQKIRIAMVGRREQRNILIRDPNRVVAAAVLSSPKLSETEIENFSRMQNVSEDVLRVIGTHRAWTRSYTVVAALVKNARTPTTVSLALLPRLQERDVKALAVDRNIPESVRLAARKYLAVQQSRRS